MQGMTLLEKEESLSINWESNTKYLTLSYPKNTKNLHATLLVVRGRPKDKTGAS